ncbi:MAG TPA: WS/DGAT domain-containing protein, partial [Fluviicoccus sp.]|nr:WS/DGAT domain-containing protein [Fluviicoccus sp.]
TDEPGATQRLQAIIESTRHAKEQLQGMSKNAILQFSQMLMAPMLLSMLPGAAGRVRPAFNVAISNVPGPENPLYFRGFRLDSYFPLSIPFKGYALNITVVSYAQTLNFGFIGCRDALPHLQRLAVYSREALEDLEAALGLEPAGEA